MMNRRSFLIRSALLAAGGLVMAHAPALANLAEKAGELKFDADLYKQFKNPDSRYRPFVRWWWNGDKVEAGELVRQLHLLKAAGIGGVEINPISFPNTADDMGKESLVWLSDEWIEMLKVVFAEAKKLDMTCDLIVGSGWPYGGEFLEGDERAQVVILDAVELEGPTTAQISEFDIFKRADPKISHTNPQRTFEIISLKLAPNPMKGLEDVIDLSDQIGNPIIKVDVPEGDFFLYALVKVDAFAEVINGAPGAAGSILNHMDKAAVRRYLDRMSDTIQAKTGPLKDHLRAFFTDSMELEGCNWTPGFAEEFQKRRGYDLMPYLPFIMYRVGRLGAVVQMDYGSAKSPEFQEAVNRVRFDFEYTKAELLRERYTETYLEWCKDQGVKSRAQAYGRGFFPQDSSIGYDIPEGESWSTNWIKHKPGLEMGEDDYRRGRAYTMINKYVSSAAHQTGKRVVSAEEMTNTYNLFNATLELLKLGSDMSAISGTTHSIWHGFNYSPPDAPFPGWVQYGSYYSEKNNWWPYFKYLNNYRARVASQLQNADMYTDIAILPANYDLWTVLGVQTDPFPEKLNVTYTSFLWEAIHKNGGGADYVSEKILAASTIKNGKIIYGPKSYGTIFLPGVTSITPESLTKLVEFAKGGGRIFCIEEAPSKSVGFLNYKERDEEIASMVEELKSSYPNNFFVLAKPEDNRFLEWYQALIKEYDLPHYMEIGTPDRFLMQNRYQTDTGAEIIFLTNVHMNERAKSKFTFSKEITRGRYPWIWNPNTGESFRIELDKDGSFEMDLGPAEGWLIVFNKDKNGPKWNPMPLTGKDVKDITDAGWEVEFNHSLEGWTKTIQMEELKDLKDTDFVEFTGTVTYRYKIGANDPKPEYINLGKVWGVAELFVNGKEGGVSWYGDKVFPLAGLLNPAGESDLIEVKVTTTMGNYMKTLTDNETAMKWLVLKNKNQEIQSMGIVGPVTLY